MRILVLSFYYTPDLCAGSFRATAFLKALTSRLGPEDTVDVLTTMPNRYKSFAPDAPPVEIEGQVRIQRIKLPSHQSGMLDQARAFTAFTFGVVRFLRGRQYDVVFATSSRLFTAWLGALAARYKRAPLYLDIRDIFTDTMKDVLKTRSSALIVPAFELIERFTIKSARRINLVSGGFFPYFKEKYPDQEYSVLTNGIDDDFVDGNFEKAPGSDRRVILYAGNIGEGQGLERIVPPAAARLTQSHRFVIVGDGGTSGRLREAVSRLGLDNVELLAPVDRGRLVELYRQSDYLFLHLNDYEAFKKVLPSKIFEYAATGKPVIAGVSGYAKSFIEENVSNAAVFAPCDVEGFVGKINQLEPTYTDRAEFIRAYKRENIMGRMAEELLDIAGTVQR